MAPSTATAARGGDASWYVFCEAGDESALWAYRALHARGLAPLELVPAPMLACNLGLEHGLTAGGDPTFRMALADGRVISSDRVRGVLNRLIAVPAGHLALADAGDREYAAQELFALFVSWLHGLPAPVINRSCASGLCGAWRTGSEWIWLARQAGLATGKFAYSTRGPLPPRPSPDRACTVFVVDRTAVRCAAPDDVLAACERLAALAGVELLGVDLAEEPAGEWAFAGATAFPDLQRGGDPLADALAAVLRGEGATS